MAILDNDKAARAWAPTLEITWPQQYWRGDYFFDRVSGKERVNFSTAPGKPRGEVTIDLRNIDRKQVLAISTSGNKDLGEYGAAPTEPTNTDRKSSGKNAGQKPAKCDHKPIENAPKYRIGWSVYSVEGPKTLFLSISIDPRNFTRDEMIALGARLKADFCKERKLVVAILDDHDAARAWAPTIEKTRPQRFWRGTYFLDLNSGEESIEFSTMRARPRNEVKINLAFGTNPQTKTTTAAVKKP